MATTAAATEVKATTPSVATTSGSRIVLVTGANQGIGFEAVKQLAAHSNLTVLLGSRDKAKGDEAVASIGKPNVKLFIVDVNDDKSIATAAETIKTQYGGLDVLVNNAGFAWKPASQFDSEVVTATFKTNYYGLLKLSNALWPLLRENGRVVNVSSMVSRWTYSKIAAVHQAKFTKRDLTVDQLTAALEEFATSVANNTVKADGWHDTAYGMSKVGVSALTEIQARENKVKGLLVNACCPGWTITNMSGGKGNKTAAQGAEVLVHLALLPAGSPTGGFWENNVQTSWTAPPPATA